MAQIYIQTDPQKAIPTLEKLVEYYPEQQQYATILEVIKQQEATPPATTDVQPEATESQE